jgi:hypothetical protein
MSEEPRAITFGKEIDPNEEAEYRRKIEAARKTGGVDGLKAKDPVGVLPRPAMPAPRAAAEAPVSRSESGGVQARPKGSPLLSQETAEQIKGLAEASARQAASEPKPEEPKKVDDEDLLEMFDFQGRNEAERILNNKKRRKEIESRLEPMKLEDLLMKDEVQQNVPVVPDKFEILFRSITPEENLYIKRYVAKNDTGQSDQYVLEKFGMCQLVCSVLAINNRPLPDHRAQDGSIDDAAFEKKLKILLRKSGYVIADLGINYGWFDIRVRKLLNPDALGNG